LRFREQVVGAVASLAAVFAMAVDHLFGTDDSDDERFAEPGVFIGTAAAAVVATVLLFRLVVRGSAEEPDRAATKAIACSLLAVLTLPLLFLAAPFPFAGAGIALGLIGRDGRRRGLATAGLVLGLGVLVLGVGAYLFALIG
jgi:4-amino-4-deoxy-L-arabinose transferase-like glycosyltransferase